MWQVTCDTLQVTHDMWQVTHDILCGVNILSKFQLSGLGVMMFWRSRGKGLLSHLWIYISKLGNPLDTIPGLAYPAHWARLAPTMVLYLTIKGLFLSIELVLAKTSWKNWTRFSSSCRSPNLSFRSPNTVHFPEVRCDSSSRDSLQRQSHSELANLQSFE